MFVDAGLQFIHAVAELFESLDHRLDPLGAEAQFFNEQHGAAATAAQSPPGGFTLTQTAGLAGGDAVIAAVPLHQDGERLEIVRQPAENLLLFEPVRHGDLDGAIEGQIAVVNAAKRPHNLLHDVITFHHFAAELARVTSICLASVTSC